MSYGEKISLLLVALMVTGIVAVGSAADQPIAEFIVQDSFTTGFAPFMAQFVDQSTQAASWSWEFGDGQSATEQNPAHTYANPGSYTVSLTVRDATGTLSSTKTIPDCITVGADPMSTGSITTETTVTTTYNIPVTTTATAIPTTTPIPAETGTLEVRSQPPGAMVTLDGLERGISPITLYSIATGPHTVLVHMKGYRDNQTRVTVVREQMVSLGVILTTKDETPVLRSTRSITTVTTSSETAAEAQSAAAPSYTDLTRPGSIRISCNGCLELLYNGRQIGSFQYQIYEYDLNTGTQTLRHFGQAKSEEAVIQGVAPGHFKVKITPENFKAQEQFTNVSPATESTVRFEGPTFVQTPGFETLLAILAVAGIATMRKFL